MMITSLSGLDQLPSAYAYLIDIFCDTHHSRAGTEKFVCSYWMLYILHMDLSSMIGFSNFFNVTIIAESYKN